MLAIVPPRATASLSNGLAFGGEEAAHTAALFGVHVVREMLVNDGTTAPLPELAGPLGGGIDGAVSALPGAAGRRLVDALARHHVCTIDIAGVHAGTPPTDGRRRVFHVRAPESPTRAGGPLELWHHTLYRYGAEQLNERYARRFGMGMDSTAWAGWFAIKALAETLLRLPATGTGGDAVASALAQAGFDGHKGRSLSFDRDTGVLVQPRYIVGRGPSGEDVVLGELLPDPPAGRR